jgi:uncharacterized MAPEG superfamily protein
MVGLILWGLIIYLIHILLPPAIYYSRPGEPLDAKMKQAAGPRDEPIALSVGGERARRAQKNYEESLPFFLTLALLLLYTGETTGAATTGAMIFLLARLVYLPVYVAGIPTLRTVCWAAAWVGLVVMGLQLFAD